MLGFKGAAVSGNTALARNHTFSSLRRTGVDPFFTQTTSTFGSLGLIRALTSWNRVHRPPCCPPSSLNPSPTAIARPANLHVISEAHPGIIFLEPSPRPHRQSSALGSRIERQLQDQGPEQHLHEPLQTKLRDHLRFAKPTAPCHPTGLRLARQELPSALICPISQHCPLVFHGSAFKFLRSQSGCPSNKLNIWLSYFDFKTFTP